MSTTNTECCSQCRPTSYLPVRSSWARAVLTKVESNQRLQDVDRRAWYRFLRAELLRDEYRALVEELHEDEETSAFLEQSQDKSDNIPVQVLHSLVSSMLTMFIARTSGTVR